MSFHAKDLRKHRFSKANHYYLITTVTHNRARLFERFSYARVVIRCLILADASRYSTTIGFVVMPDHIHWVFKLGEIKTLSNTVGFVKGLSARRINQQRSISGAIWQHGFHENMIRGEGDLREIIRYVVANPLRAGLVTTVADYPHWDCCYL